MVVNGRPLKRMKRRVTADLYDFLTFPSAGDGFSSDLDGPFRLNVRSFLSKHSRLPLVFAPAVFPHLVTWQIAFRIGEINGQDATQAAIVALDVVEEDVTRSRRSVYCDQCRVVGWSGHPVCGKRYHFIIRGDGGSTDVYHRPCTRCGALLHSLDLRCKSCNYQITVNDLEDLVYLQLADTTHLLHGVAHTNGYGHLLRINGREGGSKFLSGCDIMDFWDRLCKMLGVRKISVMDVSKKYGLEYRLLHAITCDRPWYGDWGYEFGAGSFALTAHAYREAVKALSDMPLDPFFTHGRTPRTHLQNVIAFYISLSEHRLATVRDLFRFIMELIHNKHKRTAGPCDKMLGQTAALLHPWGEDDIERVEHAMINVLCAVSVSRWVPWRSLRGAACRAGPPELLDYCLKGMCGKSLHGMVVHMRCNPESHVIEYMIKDRNAVSGDCLSDAMLSHNSITEDHLLHDLKLLYDALLHPETMLCYSPQTTWELALSSAVKLLDCKQFVKNYESDSIKILNPFVIRVWCQLVLVNHPKDYTAPPPELIVLLATATVADLKHEAEIAFRETYLLFKKFEVAQLLDFGDVCDSTNISFLIGLEGPVRIHGRCLANEGLYRFRKERGTESWIVDCTCGARDDDGERMLACDTCGVWQHTRCCGIHDFESVPEKFVCGRCGNLPRSKSATGK